MTNADKFKQIFGLYATELWSKTEGEFLAWLNSDFSQSDVPDMNVGDMISRQAAINAIMGEYPESHYPAWYAEILKKLPSAEPEPTIPLSWIEGQIKWLKSLDNAFSTLTAVQISAMVNKWRGEQDGTEKWAM